MNQNVESVFIEKVIINGREIQKNHILHSEKANGGRIIFHMTSKPLK